MNQDRRDASHPDTPERGRRRTDPRIIDPATHPRRYVSLTVAALYLEVHRTTLHKFLDERLLSYVQFGKWRKIELTELVAFAKRQRVERKAS